ncbi:MAG: hypothetical protein RLZZ69_3657 [Cyanobacteriota bacterium]
MFQLPELYSKHLKKQFNYPQYLILLILINLIQNLKTVRLEEIGRRLPVPIQLRSRVKKIQRFLSQEQFNIKSLWFPILISWLKQESTEAYAKRMGIEEMFRDFKKGGYNLEVTRVGDRRLISLILLICLSYSLSTFAGQNIKSKGVANRANAYSRIERY